MSDENMIKQYLLILAIVVITGCAGQAREQWNVSHPAYDLTTLKTYRWKDKPVQGIGMITGAGETEVSRRLVSLATAAMQRSGFVENTSGQADIEVSVLIGLFSQSTFSEHTIDSLDGFRDDRYRISQTADTDRGGISLIFTDPGNDKIIWQGTVIEKVDLNARWGESVISRLLSKIERMLATAREV